MSLCTHTHTHTHAHTHMNTHTHTAAHATAAAASSAQATRPAAAAKPAAKVSPSIDADLAAAVKDLKGTEAELKSFAERARSTCAELYDDHNGTPSLSFNEDEQFSELVQKGVAMKRHALPVASKEVLLGQWFRKASGVSVRGVEACVNIVGAKVFAGGEVKDMASGVTPLLAACRGGSFEIFDALIKANADTSAVDQQGSTALLAACQGGSFEICDALIKANADTSAVDQQGSTALLAACQGGSFEICDALIKARADVAVVRPDGASALAMSIMSGDFKVVALLLASIACKHHAGITSLQELAEAFANPSYISARMSSGASPLCLKVEIGSLIAGLRASKSVDDTEISSVKLATAQLEQVRAFLDHHASLLENPPVALRQATLQLAVQEPDEDFRAHVLIANEAEFHEDDAGGGPHGGPEAIRLIEWINKCQVRRPCRLTLRGGAAVRSVAYSPDGSRMARAEGSDVVVCCAVSGMVTCRMRGHRCEPRGLHISFHNVCTVATARLHRGTGGGRWTEPLFENSSVYALCPVTFLALSPVWGRWATPQRR